MGCSVIWYFVGSKNAFLFYYKLIELNASSKMTKYTFLRQIVELSSSFVKKTATVIITEVIFNLSLQDT